jgi:ribosomal protein L11 methyltransferase
MMTRAFRVTVMERDEDIVTGQLYDAGTDGIEVGPATDDRVSLLAYFSNDVDLATLQRRLKGVDVESVPVPDVDWVARFRESFQASRVGRFIIAPPWDRPTGDGDLLLIDPGRAFGTGTHETTRLCLGALEDLARRRDLGAVVDVGTGTGILGIAAARLGARLVVASDTDPEATASALAHARLNRVDLRLVRGDGAHPFRPAAFDLILANLTAPLLLAQARGLAALRTPSGALVLSGLLETDLKDVVVAYASCGRPDTRREGEWAALVYEGAS